MDLELEDWEFIPGEGILNLNLNLNEEEEKKSGERNIIRYANWSDECSNLTKGVVDMNYFDCPIAIAIKEEDELVKVADPQEELVSQVFFKKTTKDSEFADITMKESPRSPPPPRGFVPASAAFDFDDDDEDDDNGVDKLWKLGLTGFGAIVATVCVLLFGTQHNKRKHHPNISFHIHGDHKKKNMVKLNDAIRGAQITFGGYYEGALID